MIIQQEKDSIYISADTLFSGFTTKVNGQDTLQKKDLITSDTAIVSSSPNEFLKADALAAVPVNDSLQINTLPPTVRSKDSLRMDTLLTNTLLKDALRADTLLEMPLETPTLKDSLQVDTVKAVSYTHLTLPTICSV